MDSEHNLTAQFYVLDNPENDQTDAVTDFLPVDPVILSDSPRCPVCGRAIGMRPQLPPIRGELTLWGRWFGDVVFAPGTELLVSERFKDAFQKEGLSGLASFTPVAITAVACRKKAPKDPAPRYYLVVPALGRAAIDQQASGLEGVSQLKCEECRPTKIRRIRRIVLEPGTWSGEDMFRPRGLTGAILTSARFKQFCDHHAFKNCLLIEADKYGFDFYPWEKR